MPSDGPMPSDVKWSLLFFPLSFLQPWINKLVPLARTWLASVQHCCLDWLAYVFYYCSLTALRVIANLGCLALWVAYSAQHRCFAWLLSAVLRRCSPAQAAIGLPTLVAWVSYSASSLLCLPIYCLLCFAVVGDGAKRCAKSVWQGWGRGRGEEGHDARGKGWCGVRLSVAAWWCI